MNRKKIFPTVVCVIACLLVITATAHDLFLKLDSYFLKPSSDVSVSLINGTFDKSDNTVTRDRFLDCRIVGPVDEVTYPKESQWRDEDTTSILDFKTGSPGNYVIGVSTKPRMIELTAEEFNDYLKHDGVVDTLATRKKDGELNVDARERYAKHVKAIVQVGDKHTEAFSERFGYPVEFVPLQNPYELKVGDSIDVMFLEDGKPVADQMVYASHESFHGHDEEGNHIEAFKGRTNDKGVVSIKLDNSGRWYVRTILMKKVEEADANYESKWATLTFEMAK